MNKNITYLFLLLILPYISIAQTEITINDGTSIYVPLDASICAEIIRVNLGGTLTLNDEFGICDDADIIVVLPPPEEQISDLITEVNSIIGLNEGQKKSLITKLENALSLLDKNIKNAAINEINSFIHQVEAFIKSNKITEGKGQSLVDLAHNLIESINNLEKESVFSNINEYFKL